jgi:hypothetical protein
MTRQAATDNEENSCCLQRDEQAEDPLHGLRRAEAAKHVMQPQPSEEVREKHRAEMPRKKRRMIGNFVREQ